MFGDEEVLKNVNNVSFQLRIVVISKKMEYYEWIYRKFCENNQSILKNKYILFVCQIKAGLVNFEAIIATSDAMVKLKPHARILGPKGLMPN